MRMKEGMWKKKESGRTRAKRRDSAESRFFVFGPNRSWLDCGGQQPRTPESGALRRPVRVRNGSIVSICSGVLLVCVVVLPRASLAPCAVVLPPTEPPCSASRHFCVPGRLGQFGAEGRLSWERCVPSLPACPRIFAARPGTPSGAGLLVLRSCGPETLALLGPGNVRQLRLLRAGIDVPVSSRHSAFAQHTRSLHSVAFE
jgi:hypothetical protein